MKEEKNNQKKEQKKEDCPLCQVSDETIEILKQGKSANKEDKDKEK